MSDEREQHTARNCAGTDEKCGLSGIDAHKRFEALSTAITEIKSDYYFPVDILAASFVIEDKDSKFAPHRWSLKKSRMEDVFSQEKRLLVQPKDPPALVPLDLPKTGLRVYDADIIRALLSTELFPYRMHVVSWKRDGVKVSFVKLDRDAGKLAKDCFDEAAKSGVAACPTALSTPEPQKGAVLRDLSDPGGAVSGRSSSFVETRVEGSPSADAGKIGNQNLQLLRDLLVSLPADDDVIKITFRKTGEECLPWSRLDPAEQKLISNHDSTSCRFRLDLYIPRAAASAYSQITVRGEITKPTGVTDVFCSPPDLEIDWKDQKVEYPPASAPARGFEWILADHILRPLPSSSPNAKEIMVLVPLPDGGGGAAKPSFASAPPDANPVGLKITLEGEPKPWLKAWIFGAERRTSCFPNTNCP
jgi:hypothetical protein